MPLVERRLGFRVGMTKWKENSKPTIFLVEVECSEVFDGKLVLKDVTGSTVYRVTNLEPDTDYEFRVQNFVVLIAVFDYFNFGSEI